MFKSIINKSLKTFLSELFTNAEQNGGINLSMGNDLFSDSNINLKNLNLRPDIFDIYLQPIHLVSGNVGSFILEGIAELPLGGKLKASIEDIHLLFQIDEFIDAERAQILKKMLIELSSDNISQLLLREILKRIQGYNVMDKKDISSQADVIKQRKLLIRMISYIFQHISISMKNIHVRFECLYEEKNGDKMENTCSSMGFTLPSCRIIPLKKGSSQTESVLSIPHLSIRLKSFQIYCDYNVTSYATSTNPTRIIEEFKRHHQESHTGILLPMDFELNFTIEIRKVSGLCSFKVEGNISNLKFTFDYKQLQVLKHIFELFVSYHKKSSNNLRVKGVFGKRWLPPKLCEESSYN